MDDLISRQDVIDDIKAIYEYHDTVTEDRIIDHLKRLPSAQTEPCDDPRADVYYLAEKIGIHQLYALVVELRGEPAQPERKKGRWTITPLFIKCSECGEAFMLMPQNYCPNCGARMKGEEDNEDIPEGSL